MSAKLPYRVEARPLAGGRWAAYVYPEGAGDWVYGTSAENRAAAEQDARHWGNARWGAKPAAAPQALPGPLFVRSKQ